MSTTLDAIRAVAMIPGMFWDSRKPVDAHPWADLSAYYEIIHPRPPAWIASMRVDAASRAREDVAEAQEDFINQILDAVESNLETVQSEHATPQEKLKAIQFVHAVANAAGVKP